MDRPGNLLHLFSRSATPPIYDSAQNHPQPQGQSQQQMQQQQTSSQSYGEPTSSPPQTIDSLFRGMNISAPTSSGLHGGNNNNNMTAYQSQNQQQQQPVSAPATPVSTTTAISDFSTMSAGNAANLSNDRQSALLSLLGSVAGSSNSANPNTTSSVATRRSVTPPADVRSINEAQGKFLLEQLMSRNTANSGYNDNSQDTFISSSSPSYPQRIYGPVEAEPYHSREPSYNIQDNRPPQNSHQPPSPSRKSMFEFVSPFDALSATSTQTKTSQDMNYNLTGSRDVEDSSWAMSSHSESQPKSVENLIDQLTRSQGQGQTHDLYGPVAPPPLPPKPTQASSSPMATSPRLTVQQRISPQEHVSDSPLLQSGLPPLPPVTTGREKTASPPPRGGKARMFSSRGRNAVGYQPQTVIFDVSQPLDVIQASRDYVKSTAIALVKVDPTFIPGTTIGATHWVAYAMTKGRVRVISRSSGDRTLLQLPAPFPPSVAVTDMAVFGNRLAGVTSDGGLVVWELPEVITDDVPGRLIICVTPSADVSPLHCVKWHPKKPDILAVGSDSHIFILNVSEVSSFYGDQTIIQADLQRVGQVFPISNALVAFDFDIPHNAIATISEDSTLTIWNLRDRLPFWSHKFPGEGLPSSLTFLDGGIVIGRKNGTILQLLPVMGENILSIVKFINGNKADNDMFGHVAYDSRVQTLWVANSRRESLIAVKLNLESSTPSSDGDDFIRGGYIEQVVEFIGPRPTIYFVILTADLDPHGDEAAAACVAAKVATGDMALVAFSVHNSGVDQILIRKEWFDSALESIPTKLPPYSEAAPPPTLAPDFRQQRQVAQQPLTAAAPQTLSQPIPSVPVRLRTPPSEEVDVEHGKEEPVTREPKGKGNKGKNVGWKDKDDSSSREKEKGKATDTTILNDSPLGVALSKEIRKVEENLHTRIGRLIAKELDKQHQRLEEARVNEQAADFVRQEKILKLISTELTKNTTRVVETAVKGEVQSSVLPSLENITKTEVKLALNNQIGRGFGDTMRQVLPPEIEKLFNKPELSNQLARQLTNHLTPFIERHVKDSVNKLLIPAYQAQSTALHQELSREIHNEITNMKTEIMNWQNDVLRSQEALIRDMDQSVRALSEQIKFLTMNMPALGTPSTLPRRASPAAPGPSQFGPLQQQMAQSNRQSHMPPQASGNMSAYTNYQQPMAPPPPPGQWYGNAPPHTQQPQTPPASVTSGMQQQPKKEDWDERYLTVLGTQDLNQLRDLLVRSNPEVIMPSGGGSGPLSQAVILTLVHRLAAVIGETSPVEDAFKTSLWWLQRAATTLNTNDNLISPYVGRVLPNVQAMLKTTKQRLAILPGGHQLVDVTRIITDIQDILSRKPVPVV